MKKVTLFKGGVKQKTVKIENVEIPDMWFVAEAVRKGRISTEQKPEIVGQILDCWHICGALKKHIMESK